MPPPAYFGIESSGLSLVVDLLILFVVVLYLSLIYWTYADARRRILDPMLIGCATAASLFPFVGTIIYMILRPPEYLEDVRERELEMQAAEARLHDLDQTLCPNCDYRVERDFIRCPSCLHKLKERWVSCSRPLDETWTICPYCETEVPPSVSSSRRARRRRTPSLESPATAAGAAVAEEEIAEIGTAAERGAPTIRGAGEDPRTAPLAPPEPAVRPRPPAPTPPPTSAPARGAPAAPAGARARPPEGRPGDRGTSWTGRSSSSSP